ncbi:MAG: DM13 domain-containing protein [Candidatus Puniceispirillaceae bacterium]
MISWICAKSGRAAIFGLIAGLGIGGAVGFGLGVYFLPILTAGPGLDQVAVQALATSAERRGRFVRDLPGSGAFHWGDGTIMMNANKIWLDGTILPGPNYRLYPAPEFVDDGAGFLAIKAESRQIGTVKTFENFALGLPPAIDLDEYDAVVIWCEAFKQFITAARLEN